MQTVSSAWSAEEKDSVRKIAHNLQISWKKNKIAGNRTFTVGTSLIGGSDVLSGEVGEVGSPSNYRYFDESQYVQSLGWESGYSMPLGGLTMAAGEAKLDNTSGRFTPRFIGGHSELFTAIVPRRPAIISAGFNFNGIDQTIPQFVGVIDKQPAIDIRNGQLSVTMTDYVGFFQNRELQHATIFTAETTDTVIGGLLSQLGMTTAQYDLDPGINVIPFGFFDVGTKFSDAIGQLVQAENGHFYQDESGVFKFENRQHWDNAPYNQVQRVILTSQVINVEAPNTDHLINYVEVKSNVRMKQPSQPIMNYSTPTIITPSGTTDVFLNYTDPVLEIINPTAGGFDSFYIANTSSDESGGDVTNSVSITAIYTFGQATKITFKNNTSQYVYVTRIVISGRAATIVKNIDYIDKIGSSITAYEEQNVTVDNPFIASDDWASSLAALLLRDFSSIESIQRLIIRAIPELQKGDLISYAGHDSRVFDIKTTLDASSGYIQELTTVHHTPTSYFRLGISLIGGTDMLSP